MIKVILGVGLVCIIIGYIIGRTFGNKEEFTTDKCLKYLGDKGYRVNLNLGENRFP